MNGSKKQFIDSFTTERNDVIRDYAMINLLSQAKMKSVIITSSQLKHHTVIMIFKVYN